jgi:hypothetical protein
MGRSFSRQIMPIFKSIHGTIRHGFPQCPQPSSAAEIDFQNAIAVAVGAERVNLAAPIRQTRTGNKAAQLAARSGRRPPFAMSLGAFLYNPANLRTVLISLASSAMTGTTGDGGAASATLVPVSDDAAAELWVR